MSETYKIEIHVGNGYSPMVFESVTKWAHGDGQYLDFTTATGQEITTNMPFMAIRDKDTK